MRFNTISIPPVICSSEGITKIELTKLKSTIAFVGRNGSGKSRILKLIEKYSDGLLSLENIMKGIVDFLPESIILEIKNIPSEYKELFIAFDHEQLLLNFLKDSTNKAELETELRIIREEIKRHQEEIKSNIQIHAYPPNVVNGTLRARYTATHKEQELNKIRTEFITLRGKINKFKSKNIKIIRNEEIAKLNEKFNSSENGLTTFESLLEKVTSDREYNELNSISTTAIDYLKRLPTSVMST